MAELQMNYFKSQLQLALDYDLPVNIHSRYAGHYCIDTVRDRGLSKVQMHAYDALVMGTTFPFPLPLHNPPPSND